MSKFVQHDPDVFTIENVLSDSECQSLISRSESIGFSPASVRTSQGPKMMTNIRNNERVVLNDPELADLLYSRVVDLLPSIDGCHPTGADPQLRFYKYVPGQKFNRHRDGEATSPDGEVSKLSFLVYLNDADGGETVFRDYVEKNGKREKIELKIKAEAGNALLFRHRRWHEGSPVDSGMKYVIRTDVFYSRIDSVER